MSPRNILFHALFILNSLKLVNDGHSVADHFWHTDTQEQFATVLRKGPIDKSWHGLNPVLIWGQGSVCIYSNTLIVLNNMRMIKRTVSGTNCVRGKFFYFAGREKRRSGVCCRELCYSCCCLALMESWSHHLILENVLRF